MGGFGQSMPNLAGMGTDPRRLSPLAALFQQILARRQAQQAQQAQPQPQPQARQQTEPPQFVQDPFQQAPQRIASGWQALWAPSGTTADDPQFWEPKAQGASDIMAGAAPFMTPLALAGIAEAPVGALLGLGAGLGAQAGTEEAARRAGVPPGMAALTSDIAGLWGGAAGAAGAEGLTPERLVRGDKAPILRRRFTANVPQAEADRAGTWNLGRLGQGKSGISMETDPVLYRMRRMVYRDPSGTPQGYLHFYLDDDLKNVAPPEHELYPEVYVNPGARRQGIATKLYDAAANAGYDLSQVSGTETSPSGAAFLNARQEALAARESERGSWSWKPGTKLAQIPESVEIPRSGKRLTIHDLGAYFNERIGKTLGQVPADAPPSRKLNRILKVAIPEFEDQLQQPDPKLDFYTTDTPQADRDIKQAYPELKTNPSKFIIQKAMSANFSPGSEPIDEAYNGARAYDIYKRTGKVPLTQASGVGWQGYNAAATMARLQKYIDYFGGGEKGEKALAKFITTKHTIREMQQINPNVYGTKAMQNDIVHGSLIFGTKVGEYFDDIMGIKRASSTIDQWEVRANQRRLGDTLRNGKLIDTPLTNSDRDVFKELHHILADRYKLTRNQAQSGTWHYEKGLYTRLGVPSPPTGRSEGTLRALEEMGQSRPPNPKAKPTQLNLRQLQVKPSGPPPP